MPSSHDFDTAPIIAALNIVLAKHGTSNGVVVGTNRFFFPTEKSSLDGLLDAYKGKFIGQYNSRWLLTNFVLAKGFYSSVRPTFRQLSINLNASLAFSHPFVVSNGFVGFRLLPPHSTKPVTSETQW